MSRVKCMSCYHPIPALILMRNNPDTGKMKIKLLPKRGNFRSYQDQYGKHNLLLLPCGHCLGCVQDRTREWATRLSLESKYHEHTCFLTLTYDDAHVPGDRRVHKRDLQLFFKRLRRKIGCKIRYFACGEYGENTFRPHYHVILFGYDFPDKKIIDYGSNNDPLYVSDELAEIWTDGLHSIGEVSEQSCSYTARYSQKKLLGQSEFGDEFVLMSTRPPIGISYLEDHPAIWDVDKIVDKVLGRSHTASIPRIFEKKFPFDEKILEEVKEQRIKRNQVITAHKLHLYGSRYLEKMLLHQEDCHQYVPKFKVKGV